MLGQTLTRYLVSPDFLQNTGPTLESYTNTPTLNKNIETTQVGFNNKLAILQCVDNTAMS